MHFKSFIIRIIIPFISIISIALNTANAEDLLQVYSLAVQHDTGLSVALKKKIMGMEAVPQGLAPLLPSSTLTLQHSGVNMHKPVHDSFDKNGYTLSLQVPVFHWENTKGYEKSQKEEQKAILAYATAGQELVMRSVKLYYDVLSAVDGQQLAIAERESMGKRLESVKAGLEVGTAVLNDLQDAQAAFDLAQSGVIAAENQLQSRMEALKEVIGQPAGSLNPLKEEIPLIKPDPDDIESWVTKAQTENLSLQLARLDTEISAIAAQAAMAGHLPAVDLMAAHNYSDNGALPQFDGGLMNTDSFTLQMVVPLYSGHGATSKVRQAAATRNMTQEAEDAIRRQVVRQTRDAFRGVVTAIAQIKAARQVLISTQGSLETTDAGYASGIRTMTDVLAAQREVFRAKRDFSQSRYTYILQSLELKQAAGLLSQRDLEAVNAWNQH
ncbi:MAG: TolC family type I secretion outer rane protein [Magnetococcales bacterium]|nr:TolC family type I secretion outer rane protein [Magnetococcales bacterium]